jgi:hypothetical protein
MPVKCYLFSLALKNLGSFGILLQFHKTNILIRYIHKQNFASLVLLATSIIIVNQYFVLKSNYYFVYILPHLQHIIAHSEQLFFSF